MRSSFEKNVNKIAHLSLFGRNLDSNSRIGPEFGPKLFTGLFGQWPYLIVSSCLIEMNQKCLLCNNSILSKFRVWFCSMDVFGSFALNFPVSSRSMVYFIKSWEWRSFSFVSSFFNSQNYYFSSTKFLISDSFPEHVFNF